MFAATHIAPVGASVATVKPTTEMKHLRYQPEVVNYELKKFAYNPEISEMGFAILRYTQQANMVYMQYADDLCDNSCKVTGDYDKIILNDIFIEKIDSSICQSLRKYWATHEHVSATDITIKAQSLLAI